MKRRHDCSAAAVAADEIFIIYSKLQRRRMKDCEEKSRRFSFLSRVVVVDLNFPPP
jgi:hypothetical protein